jgi:hypothetical protein
LKIVRIAKLSDNNSLEREQKRQKLNRQNTAIPRPDDEYLRRVSYKTYEAEDEVHDEAANKSVHELRQATSLQRAPS